MTDPDVADKTYIEPITLEVLEKILQKRNQMQSFQLWVVRQHLILQWKLRKRNFKKYKIELIGANSKAIANAE